MDRLKGWWKIVVIDDILYLSRTEDYVLYVNGVVFWYDPEYKSSEQTYIKARGYFMEDLLGQMFTYLQLKKEGKDIGIAKHAVLSQIEVVKALNDQTCELYYYNMNDFINYEEFINV